MKTRGGKLTGGEKGKEKERFRNKVRLRYKHHLLLSILLCPLLERKGKGSRYLFASHSIKNRFLKRPLLDVSPNLPDTGSDLDTVLLHSLLRWSSKRAQSWRESRSEDDSSRTGVQPVAQRVESRRRELCNKLRSPAQPLRSLLSRPSPPIPPVLPPPLLRPIRSVPYPSFLPSRALPLLPLLVSRRGSRGVALIYRAIIIEAAKWIRSNRRFPDAIRSDSRTASLLDRRVLPGFEGIVPREN